MFQEWDILRLDDTRSLPSNPLNTALSNSLNTALVSTPSSLPPATLATPSPLPSIVHTPSTIHAPTLPSQLSTPIYQEFFLDTIQPQPFAPYPQTLHYPSQQQPTYQSYQPSPLHPQTTYYSPSNAVDLDLKRHTVRSPVSGKFVRTGNGLVTTGGSLPPSPTKPRPERRERPRPVKKAKEERDEEPEYAPEVIANAHLTLENEHYVCSVCKMKFKQPGNARRHIITVHRNEKPHVCVKCDARFGRKVGVKFD